MARFLIYLFPAMMDMVIGAVLFTGCVRVAESGGSATAVASVLITSFSTYILVCPVLGRLVTPRNAAGIVIGATALTVLNAAMFVLFPSLQIMYLWVAVQALATACFFVPFQIFMKTVEQHRPAGLSRATALYTFSWSMGLCFGPFISGYVWEYFDWQWCYGFNAVLAAATTIGIILLRHHAHSSPVQHSEPAVLTDNPRQPLDYTRLPDFAWLGWLCAGVGCLAFYMIFSLFPSTAQAYAIPRATQGTVIALVGGAQALTGLSLIRSRSWMYLVKPVLLFGLSGILGLLLFGSAGRVKLFSLAAICFGIYSGSFFFYFVFHSLVHPTRSSRYVAINETVVGICGIVGPLTGGLMADHWGFGAPYYFMAAMVALAVCFKALVHYKHADRIRLAIQSGQ